MLPHTIPRDLVTGESGTGKELIVRGIHSESIRREGLFVMVNCGAIPVNMLESWFIGDNKGALTGAEMIMRGCLNRLIVARCFSTR